MKFTRNDDDTADAAASTEWIADATRRLAGLATPGSEPPEADPRWGADAIDRLRSAISQQVSALPRRSRPIATVDPAVTVTPLALSRAITAALSESAAAESGAIADVALDVADADLTGVHVHLVAVDTGARARTFLDGGDELRARTADVLRRVVGIEDVRVDVTWEDLLTHEPS